MRTVVVVGGSLAGLHAAETLRHEGFDGAIVLVGEELHRPYDRPPLSKQVLAGTWEPDRATLPGGGDESLELDWRLGLRATGLDLGDRTVALDDGSAAAFDGLVIATGASPRRLPGTGDLSGVHTLRTIDDCLAVRGALDAGVNRVVVVGAGFIGAEVAATCRSRGVAVTLVEALPVPLGRVLGAEMGAVCAEVHREQGVDVRLGVSVAGIVGDGRAEEVVLVDGSVIESQLVVVGVGVSPNTGWLEGSGVPLDNGVVCDATTLAAPGVVAAGDVARWPNQRFDELMRVEHWDNAIEMGAHAARRLLAGDQRGEPYEPVPWFWSDQYDRKIQLAGHTRPDDEVRIVHGSVADRRFVALYGRGGRVVGALGFNMPAKVVRYRLAIADGLSWDDALTAAEA